MDEAATLHPKRRKPSSKDLILSMPTVPTELVTEILLKLPVKSLLRFRCVLKSWLALISSPEFAKTHLFSSANNKDYTHHRVMFKCPDGGVKDCSLNSLHYDSVTEAFDLDYPGKDPNGYSWIVGSVNGLICLAIQLSEGPYDLFLWNPSIKKYKKLPNSRLNASRHYYEDECVEFQFGFAYEEFKDDYKVVGIFPIYKNDHLCRVEVQIYSLKKNSWRRIDDFKGGELLHVSGKLVNVKLHWLERGWIINSIGLADEKWAEVEHPFYSKGYRALVLAVFESDLSMVCHHMWTDVDVLVMKEYGVKESWTKMFTVKSNIDDSTRFLSHPLVFMSNSGAILLQLNSRFMKYNSKEDTIRYLDVTNFVPFMEAAIYIKSLVCPFLQNGPQTRSQRRQKLLT